jgi:AraC-like DNA-binding protein
MPALPGAELRLERGAALSPGARAHDGAALILPLRRSALSLHVGALEERLDRSCFALVPAHARYRLVAATASAEVVTIVLGEGAWQGAVREYRPYVDPGVVAQVVGTRRMFTRTRWVDELTHRYLFERDVCGKHASKAARFLETELAKEVYFLGEEQLKGHARASLASDESDVMKRALQWIDARLFEPFSLDAMARHCHASESTLLRGFRRETGATPAAYVRERRLEEAHLLLQGGRWSIGEIARRVGYTSVAAFTVAFGRRFGVPPSEARTDTEPSQLLPPHGEPPRGPRPATARTRLR